MKPRILFFLIIAGCATSKPAQDNPWGKIQASYPGQPESIGSYSAGCLKGAKEIALTGPGYQIMRPSRRRYFGHPVLVSFLKNLGSEVKQEKLGSLLVGDLGQSRGGPMPTGHASHQIGLDVDIWYWSPDFASERPLTTDERENMGAVTMVTRDAQTSSQWQQKNARILQLVTSDLEVERVFVNPAIKRELCRTETDHRWLRKLRPWWGHDDHFHVRLHCQKESLGCTNQDPVPNTDGCGADLDWWFTDEAKQKGVLNFLPRKIPKLPDACAALIPAP